MMGERLNMTDVILGRTSQYVNKTWSEAR